MVRKKTGCRYNSLVCSILSKASKGDSFFIILIGVSQPPERPLRFISLNQMTCCATFAFTENDGLQNIVHADCRLLAGLIPI